MKINQTYLLLAAATGILTSTFSANLPVQALTWTINNGTTETQPTTSIIGSFAIDDENSTTPTITFSDIKIDSLTFTAADVIKISLATPSGSGITAIDWLKDSDSLSLVFDSPFLTTAGGTINLNNIVSDFNGNVIKGSVTSVPEPLTILGSVTAIGFGLFFKRKMSHS